MFSWSFYVLIVFCVLEGGLGSGYPTVLVDVLVLTKAMTATAMRMVKRKNDRNSFRSWSR